MEKFSNLQKKRLSNILDNAGQVLLGTLIINPLLDSESNKQLVYITLVGLSLTIFAWVLSLKLEGGDLNI